MNAAFLSAMVFITVMAIIENLAIVAMTFAFRQVRSVPQSALIVSMSMADLLIGVIVMPLALYYEFNLKWELGLIMCDFWISADIMCSTASILSIAFISIDKYFSLIHSSRYFGRERLRWVRLFVGVTWATATFVAFSAGASGWARAKPLPPRDFHADLDQVIADWPLRVNFSNINLREALEYVENLESEAAIHIVEEECTITNNPIFALYSGMVSFYLPATAILYFSCKIRWISAVALARHERITTQRKKMKRSKASRKKLQIDHDGDDENLDGDIYNDDDVGDQAAFQEYARINQRSGDSRRPALGLRNVARPHAAYTERRRGFIDAGESEIFSDDSMLQNEITPVGEYECAILPGLMAVPQNSTATLHSISSSGTIALPDKRRLSEDRCRKYSLAGHAARAATEDRVKRYSSVNYGPTNTFRHRTGTTVSDRLHLNTIARLGNLHSREVSPAILQRGRRSMRVIRRRSTLLANDCTPSSIQYVDESSFISDLYKEDSVSTLKRNNNSSNQLLRVPSIASSRQRMSLRNFNLDACTYFDDISLRYIDESTANSYAGGDITMDLLPLPNLPPGVILSGGGLSPPRIRNAYAHLPTGTGLRLNAFLLGNDNDLDRASSRQSLSPSQLLPINNLANTELGSPCPRRSTGGTSVQKTARAVFTKLKGKPRGRADSKGPTRKRPRELGRKFQKLSLRLRGADAHGHINAIGEYRAYMKRLRRKERQTATLWLATVITFLGCWAPFFFCYPLSCFVEVPITLMILLPWLGYANSTINPILHAFVEPVYLRAMARIIVRILPRWL